MTLGSQQGCGCDGQAAKAAMRESGSQAVFKIFLEIHSKTWGDCLPHLSFLYNTHQHNGDNTYVHCRAKMMELKYDLILNCPLL